MKRDKGKALSLKGWFNKKAEERRAKKARKKPKRRKGLKHCFLAAALAISGAAVASRAVDVVRHTPPNGTVIAVDLKTRIVTQHELPPSYDVNALPSRATAEKGYSLPAYESLPPAWQGLLERSAQPLGFKGANIYNALAVKQRACLLNLLAKAQATRLPGGTSVLDHLQELREVRQDRIFVAVDAALAARMDAESALKDGGFYRRGGLDGVLHCGPGDFDKHASYKTRDARGAFDITLSQEDGAWLAEMDIDYYRGMRHFFFEVAWNHVFDTHTDPGKVEKILRKHQGIDPGYRP